MGFRCTDSGFEGFTALYYSQITFGLNPEGRAPAPDGGDFSASGWPLFLIGSIGLVLIWAGTRLLATRRSHVTSRG